jgi:hypothetical protein
LLPLSHREQGVEAAAGGLAVFYQRISDDESNPRLPWHLWSWIHHSASHPPSGPSSRRPAVVWPPSHRRDRQRRSFPRTDPACRGQPAWVPESVRLAMPVGNLHGDVFVAGSALDRLPTITFCRSRPHYQRSSRCRAMAGLFGFLTLRQSRDGPTVRARSAASIRAHLRRSGRADHFDYASPM